MQTLRQTLVEGDQNGAPQPFDFAAFTGPSALSTGAEPLVAEYRLNPAAQADLDGIFDYTARNGG